LPALAGPEQEDSTGAGTYFDATMEHAHRQQAIVEHLGLKGSSPHFHFAIVTQDAEALSLGEWCHFNEQLASRQPHPLVAAVAFMREVDVGTLGLHGGAKLRRGGLLSVGTTPQLEKENQTGGGHRTTCPQPARGHHLDLRRGRRFELGKECGSHGIKMSDIGNVMRQLLAERA
jgi:hypothetical protein